jgi:hypothetical protein
MQGLVLDQALQLARGVVAAALGDGLQRILVQVLLDGGGGRGRLCAPTQAQHQRRQQAREKASPSSPRRRGPMLSVRAGGPSATGKLSMAPRLRGDDVG